MQEIQQLILAQKNVEIMSGRMLEEVQPDWLKYHTLHCSAAWHDQATHSEDYGEELDLFIKFNFIPVFLSRIGQ